MTHARATFGTIALAAFMAAVAVFATNEDVMPALGPSVVLGVTIVVLTWIDLDRWLLPDWLTYPLIAAGFVLTWWTGASLLHSFAGAIAGYTVIWALSAFWKRARGEDGIGLGDAKLLAAAGTWLGVTALPVVLLVASGSGLAAAAFGLAGRSPEMVGRRAMPFGPFLSAGIWLVWCVRALLPL